MRIKYFGNIKDDNGDIRENTRVAVIYYKDSEKDKASEVFHVLKNRFVYSSDNGYGLNEDWFKVIDRDDFEDLKEIYLEVKRGEYIEPETAEPTPEQPENVPEIAEPTPEQPEDEPENVTESEECFYCRECIYYEKCSVNAPYRMECKSDCLSLCGSPVCCEDFVSRKSIDDIYEEQLKDEPETLSECRLCKKCVHYGENGCRMECSEYECKFGLHGVPCCLGFQTIDEEFSKDPFYRECGIYVGDEPLPEPKPNPNLEPLPEPQHSPEFYCHQKSESDALIKNS